MLMCINYFKYVYIFIIPPSPYMYNTNTKKVDCCENIGIDHKLSDMKRKILPNCLTVLTDIIWDNLATFYLCLGLKGLKQCQQLFP